MPHLLIGKIDRSVQPAQGWTFCQTVFCHSDLLLITYWKHSLLLLIPPAMLLHLITYSEIPKQPRNPMLASLNPVTSEVPNIQLAQPDNPEARVYG